MKVICILCEDSVVEEVRKSGKIMGTDIMKIPVSSTGELPATHWLCRMSITESSLEKLKEQRKELISSGKYLIEESLESQFLDKCNLKRIK